MSKSHARIKILCQNYRTIYIIVLVSMVFIFKVAVLCGLGSWYGEGYGGQFGYSQGRTTVSVALRRSQTWARGLAIFVQVSRKAG